MRLAPRIIMDCLMGVMDAAEALAPAVDAQRMWPAISSVVRYSGMHLRIRRQASASVCLLVGPAQWVQIL